jgi:small GTP-binding protein
MLLPPVVKGIVLGDSGSGKTSVILSYFQGTRVGASTIPTAGVDFYRRDVIVDSQQYRLQMWDTAGQERYRGVSVSYIRRADVVLLFFAVDCVDSFRNVPEWAELIDRSKTGPGVAVVLVGNKADLAETRTVAGADAEECAARYGWPYCETSALTGEGIGSLVDVAVCEVVRRKGDALDAAEGATVPLGEERPQKTAKCC